MSIRLAVPGIWLAMSSLAGAVEIGANVNEGLLLLERPLLDASHTSWVRGFVPALAFTQGPRRVETDEGLARMLEAARDGRRVILSLKWNLKAGNCRVPAPDSDTERAWFEWVARLLAACDGRLSIFVLANEPMIDTMPEDLEAGPDGVVPFARFTERLLARVSELGVKERDGKPLPLYLGAFTRLQAEPVQTSPAVRALLDLSVRDSRVAGVDVHLHNRTLDETRAALEFLRSQVAKPVIVTEFSLVWRYKAALKQPIGASDKGRAFAEAHGLAPSMKVLDYLNHIVASPISQEEWRAFLASQPWYVPDYLSKMADIMREHGVSVAAYSFSQGTEQMVARKERIKISADQPPYGLNPLFVRLFCKPPAPGVAPVNAWVFDDYVRLQASAPDSRPSTE
ncbi:MAG: hypothetical protein NTW86_27575 [Candidatus Sumerlaeota bacterium]|nr:hypothetical protein [Candidatus Sumerlaeota bacterium]